MFEPVDLSPEDPDDLQHGSDRVDVRVKRSACSLCGVDGRDLARRHISELCDALTDVALSLRHEANAIRARQ